jgi:hypothetical protein
MSAQLGGYRLYQVDLLSSICKTIDQVYPFKARGKSVVFQTKLGATACTTYAKSLPAATSKALFSVSPEQISLIQLKISGPAPN